MGLKKDTIDNGNNQNSNSNVQYSYGEMKVLYKYTTGNDTYQLYLYDNGTFTINNDKTIFAESSITENNINGKNFEKCTVEEERKFIEASDTKSSLDFTELLNSLNKVFDAMN